MNIHSYMSFLIRYCHYLTDSCAWYLRKFKLSVFHWYLSFHETFSIDNFSKELLSEMVWIIAAYAILHCHQCGSTDDLTQRCKIEGLCVCMKCTKVCLEHDDICCCCCVEWGQMILGLSYQAMTSYPSLSIFH